MAVPRPALVAAAAVAAAVLLWCFSPGRLFRAPYSTVLLDRNGALLGASIAGDGQWRFPPGGDPPEKFARAVILYEDHRFHSHFGVDPVAVLRAVRSNVRAGRVVSGASTLSMQVVRLSRGHPARTVREKILEMILAVGLEATRSKREILALYAAHAPFGGNVVGLEAASWRYFARSPDQLSWAESAMLAVLPNSPSLVFPGKGHDRLLAKRNRLLDRLHGCAVIDGMTATLAKAEPLPGAPHPLPVLAPHLLGRVRQQGGHREARVATTLDKGLQERATEIIGRHHRRLAGNGIHNAAALVLDVRTMEALVYVGNIPDFSDAEHGNFVDVVTAPRSTGSVLKPLLYAAMLDAGELLPEELVPDIPTRIGGFVPQNYSGTFEGAVAADRALARSVNVPAVRMLEAFGVDRFYGVLKGLGMTSLHRAASGYGLTLVLGGAEGTLWDLTGIYAGLARAAAGATGGGPDPPFSRPRYLLSSPPDPAAGARSALGPAACWRTLEALLEVSRPDEEGAWRSFASSRPVAWKTGTSYGLRDGWAIGVTPGYAVGVWVGNADGEGRPGLTGIAAAAPVMFEIFGILGPTGWFDAPESGMVEIEVCARSGHRAGPFCGETKKIRVPLAGQKGRSCPHCRLVPCDPTMQWRVDGSCERIGSVRPVSWFVLPPAWEWFYRSRHADYRPLPPYRSDCREGRPAAGAPPLSLLYPGDNGAIYVPVELDGSRGRTVFEAAHRNPELRIHWHLDKEFLGTTRDIHRMALDPGPGPHTITLVDENGERLEQSFRVLAGDRRDGPAAPSGL